VWQQILAETQIRSLIYGPWENPDRNNYFNDNEKNKIGDELMTCEPSYLSHTQKMEKRNIPCPLNVSVAVEEEQGGCQFTLLECLTSYKVLSHVFMQMCLTMSLGGTIFILHEKTETPRINFERFKKAAKQNNQCQHWNWVDCSLVFPSVPEWKIVIKIISSVAPLLASQTYISDAVRVHKGVSHLQNQIGHKRFLNMSCAWHCARCHHR